MFLESVSLTVPLLSVAPSYNLSRNIFTIRLVTTKSMSKLPLYDKFKKKFGKNRFERRSSSEYKRLGDYRAVVLENKLEKLKRIGQYNKIEGSWWDLIDPTLSMEENVNKLSSGDGFELPPDIAEEYGQNMESREEAFQEWKEERESGQQQHDDRDRYREEALADDIETKTLSTSEQDNDEEASKDDISSSLGDEFGYATIGRAPAPLVELLDRIKEEEGLPSRRAVIEHLVAHKATVDNFEDDKGDLWDEWYEAIRASKHLRIKEK